MLRLNFTPFHFHRSQMKPGPKPRYGKKRWGTFTIEEIARVANNPEQCTLTYLTAIYHAARKRHTQEKRTDQERWICFEAMKKIKNFINTHPNLERGFRKYTTETIVRNRVKPVLPEDHPKVLHASTKASQWLADANELYEKGEKAKAERFYAKAQYWLDRYNKLTGKS